MKKPNLFYTTIFLIFLITSLPLVSAYSLTYDANGNLVTGDGKFRIYDGFNHLVQVRNGDNATAPILENYTWHPVEDRIVIKDVYDNGTWKETVYYSSKDFVRVENSSGTYDYKYIYQNGQLVAFENYDGKKFFVLGDHKGSASVITNESGAKVEETFYEPFGKIISGGATSRFQYEAKEFDSIVGMHDFGARQKLDNPPVFAQPDMNIPDVYNPQDLNRYTFERNNPYKYEDKDGKNPALVVAGIILGAAAIVGFGVGFVESMVTQSGPISYSVAAKEGLHTSAVWSIGAVISIGSVFLAGITSGAVPIVSPTEAIEGASTADTIIGGIKKDNKPEPVTNEDKPLKKAPIITGNTIKITTDTFRTLGQPKGVCQSTQPSQGSSSNTGKSDTISRSYVLTKSSGEQTIRYVFGSGAYTEKSYKPARSTKK